MTSKEEKEEEEEGKSRTLHPSNSPFEEDELDEEFAKELAAQADRLTPTVKYYLTGKRKRKSGEGEEKEEENEFQNQLEPTPFGPDPLQDGNFDIHAPEEDEENASTKKYVQSDEKHIKKQEYMAGEAYKPNTFGGFRDYMKNKRMKLKVQELSMSEDELMAKRRAEEAAAGATDNGSNDSTIAPQHQYQILFKGTNIYINGHTNPPYGELRRLIHLHGGELMPYLDTKSPVTHIIASNLTAKKRIEFKDYRVVRPEWITQSIVQGKRLDWRDFRCSEDSTGAMNAGALGAQSIVGQKQAIIDAENAKKQLEQARTAAARGEWRMAGNAEGESIGSTANALKAYAHSGSGAGIENGVGPWGKSSRQRTLGGWARKDELKTVAGSANGQNLVSEDGDRDEAQDGINDGIVAGTKEAQKEMPVEVDEKEDDSEEGQRFQSQSSKPSKETKMLPPSIQMTAEDEEWDEAPSRNDGTGDGETKQNEDSNFFSLREAAKDTDMTTSTPVTPTKNDESNEKIFPYLGTDPPKESLAIAAGLRNVNHPYSSRPSNSKAAELMASPSWRERNTATSDSFLQGYFTKSRLHHLSTWKSEMREMVGQALREAKREEGSIDLPAGLNRVIFHIDFDAFFVSVGLRNRSDLQDRAVVVCHADSETPGNSSTSEIASCNYVARGFGIRNGMSLGQARRYCPSIATIPYDFTAYNDIAIKFYTLLLTHADAIEAVSIDEALIDVSFLLDEMRNNVQAEQGDRKTLMTSYKDHQNSQGNRWTEEKQLAEALRDEIRKQTGCEASIGIGSNILLARLATRKAKPGGSFQLKDDDIDEFVQDLEIDDLHGVGWSIRNRCKDVFGTCVVGELKEKATKSKFVALFGDKHGVTLWEKLHGKEREKLESVKPRQSCGASVNYAIRFTTEDEVKDFIRRLSAEVSNRLKAIHLVGKICCISLMVRSKDAPVEAPKFLGHGICDSFNRSTPLPRMTDDKDIIFNTAWKLISALRVKPDQLRGMGVSLQKLEPKDMVYTPAKRDAGQSMLSFKKREKVPEKDASTDVDIQGETDPVEGEASDKEEEEFFDETEARDPHSDTSPKIQALPAGTQFVIPPISQLDQSVLAALPDAIRDQIVKKQANSMTGIKQKEPPQPEQESVPLPANSPASSVTATPKKQKIIDPFERMRAASMTPTKKSKLKKVTINSAPSTPSGSQKNANARQAWEPTWSQVDPKVLSELPEEVRREIMRQFQNATGSSSNMARAIENTMERVKSEDPLSRRSISESPRKKQAYLDVLGLRANNQEDANAKAIIDSNAPLPPILSAAHRGKFGIISRSSPGPSVQSMVKIDPAKVTREELIQLEIDPDVFFALPLNVQRETLDQQSNLIAGKKARFKVGRHTDDLTIAQQRVTQRRNAVPEESDEAMNLRANCKTQSINSQIAIKGKSSTEEVCELITAWIERFAHLGPRERDVDRFKKFLIECIEGLKTRKISCDPPIDGLERVYAVLECWTRLLRRIDWNEEESLVKQKWWDSFNGVREQINVSLKRRFGATFSIKN